jgi:hypothetical protein
MVGLMGAQFSKPLVANKVTHLICYKFEGLIHLCYWYLQSRAGWDPLHFSKEMEEYICDRERHTKEFGKFHVYWKHIWWDPPISHVSISLQMEPSISFEQWRGS